MMPRFKVLLPLALATLFATAFTATSVAQSAYPAGPGNTTPNTLQSQPAPIERAPAATSPNNYGSNNGVLAAGQTLATTSNVAMAQPAPGVFLRVGQNSAVQAVATGATDNSRTELRVEHGIANVAVHHADHGAEIFVDLPGGQTALLKDGLYTFNAGTDTIRVLHGEADAYPGSASGQKPIKVKENHAVTFNGAQVKSVEFQPFQARADVIPFANGYASNGDGYPGHGPYGDGYAYGYPYYGYPFYAYGGYPYGFWGDPYWGYGYPFGFGLGFGYYGGGFGYGGGFRGGYGGFHGGGGGFHGGGGHR